MSRCLILNVTNEPLGVVSSRRAVTLVLTDRIDVVAVAGERWRHATGSVVVPTVGRVRSYVRLPHRSTVPLSRRAVMVRDQGRCQYCGDRADSVDHVVPKSRGGAHTWENVVAACRPCNTRKSDRPLSSTGLTLRTRPRPPAHRIWTWLSVGSVPDDWRPYVEPVMPADVAA